VTHDSFLVCEDVSPVLDIDMDQFDSLHDAMSDTWTRFDMHTHERAHIHVCAYTHERAHIHVCAHSHRLKLTHAQNSLHLCCDELIWVCVVNVETCVCRSHRHTLKHTRID